MLDFLRNLETTIEKMEAKEVEPSLKIKASSHFDTCPEKNQEIEVKCRQKLLELRKVLMRIREIRNSNGDMFFVSVARTFFAKS